MVNDPRVDALLEVILDTGCRPEEACRDTPHLLPAVQDRWRRLEAVRAELGDLFPGPDSVASNPVPSEPDRLPLVPGYEVQAVLGRGGMGVVYRARHLRLNRPVALKMLLAGAYARPDERERFLREAEAVAGLRHADVVQVYDVGDQDGRPYFTMEFMDGGSLARRLAGSPLSAPEAATLVAILANAVQAAHAGGVIHRDLKPANVLLTADGRPKVGDFGLARRLEGDAGLTRSGGTIGTPSYMAPEQARGDTDGVGPTADVYALGAILYEVLTGRPPFRAATAAETLRQVLTDDPAPPSRLNRSVPRDLETVCLKCLHKEPARRYPTAAALADDLGRFRRGEPVTARPISVVERFTKWVRRRPTLAVSMIAGLLVIVLIGGGVWRWAVDRATTVQGVEDDLRIAEHAQQRAAWAEARTALERADARLGDRGIDDLRGRISGARRELSLVARLDAIRLARASAGGRRFDRNRADRDYLDAFSEAGLGTPDDPPDRVAERIGATQVREAVIAALGDWTLCTPDVNRRVWLLGIARLADPDPEWGDRVRDPAVWRKAGALAALAHSAPIDSQSVSLLLMLGWLLDAQGEDAVGFLRRVQDTHPADFWLNFSLGELLDIRTDADAVGYYRAAVAARPEAAAGHVNLGASLANQGRRADAMACWRHTLRLDPGVTMAHFNLAVAHMAERRFEEAITHTREAIRIDPEYGHAHAVTGQSLLNLGRFAEARTAADRALELLSPGDPTRSNVEKTVALCRRMLAIEGRADAVERGAEMPTSAAEGIEFAQLLTFKGRYAAAAHMYVNSFARAPHPTRDLGSGNRYNAACVAALAGCGRGADAVGLREAERTRWRAQASAWLRADLAVLGKMLDTNASSRNEVRDTLVLWRTDADLSGLREPAELSKLPAGERTDCLALWAEVGAVLRRCGAVR